ncbi:hypothetical protein E2C01_046499 [Portunus trituberculatus]|uniref:DUF7041 domain-containing protein n=1 Tax=Portunus trituberculatus TaxID=210409 RepID=A0A5B7G504_PORTR|nr:hypothetical protein [Portunus trituberculatus]
MATSPKTATLTAHVAFRPPPFCSQDPSMWFSILKCNFNSASITANLTKFTHSIALIPPNILSRVSDVVINAHTSATPYDDLPRLQELLYKELSDEKPSGLPRLMKKLLDDKYDSFDKELIRHLYFRHLPITTQQSLFSIKDNLLVKEIAQLTDDFMATLLPSTSVVAVTEKSGQDLQLAELVSKLTLQVNAISQQLKRHPRSRTPQCFRRCSRSSSKSARASSSSTSACFYHCKFSVVLTSVSRPVTSHCLL